MSAHENPPQEDVPKVPYSEAKAYVRKTLKAVEAGIFPSKEDAREGIKKPWEDGTLRYFVAEKGQEVERMLVEGALYVTKPWLTIPEEILNNDRIAKIESGNEGKGLVLEHRLMAQQEGRLTANSSGQVYSAYKEGYEEVLESAHDPEFVQKVKAVEGFALGDDDLGATFTLWLLQRIQQDDDITKYKDIVRLVSDHDKRGRIHIYPKGESMSSLIMTNWGIMLAAEDNRSKVAQFLTVFDYLERHPECLHDGIPSPTHEAHDVLERWTQESRAHVDRAEVFDHYIVCNDCAVLDGETRWDQIGVEGYRKYDGKKAVITISPIRDDGKKEVQILTHGAYYLPPFATFLKQKGLAPWYGDGYLGLYTQEDYTEQQLIEDFESYLTKHYEELTQAVEFEVVFDDRAYMEDVMNFALQTGLVTGYNTTPEYYQANSSYLWDEYGDGSTTARQTRVNHDAIEVVRFLAQDEDREKITQYLNIMFGKRDAYPDGYTGKQHEGWIAPLIKVTEKGVNSKFAQYLEASST